ncbi:MAG: beta-carotene 15,15'-dioxygenase, Brp/Blh family [Flavobacteriaceae bacterium]|nr:beta-carotene 15,15'-dioxygenase, Brp/Blh family [Flavobacteriaceae bacterium]
MKSKGLFISAHYSFAVVATFFALWLAVFFDAVTEDYFGYILIITIGILHGANDIRLIGHAYKNKTKVRPLILYVLIVMITALAFYFIPALALLLFVLLSCYHFGEQHWVHKMETSGPLQKVFFMIYGIIIFSLLFYLNSEETISVIENIAQVSLSKSIFAISALLACLLSLVFVLVFKKGKSIAANWVEEVFLLLLFGLVFSIASLTWAFAIYFVLWHSIPSLNDQMQLLYGKSNRVNLKSYLKSSWVYYISAIIGLGLTLYFLRNQEQLFLSLFFSFLAAITLPHVLVMMKVYNTSD